MSQMLKGKFYVRLVLTLLLFSIFPMIFLAISIYAYSSNLLKSEINNSIYLLQEQAKEKWDANMESIQTDMLSYMLNNSHINAFAYKTTQKDFYLTGYLLTDMIQLKASNSYIEDIVVYIKDIDFIMNCEGSMRSDFYFEKFQNEQLKELILSNGFWNTHYLDSYKMIANTFDAVMFGSSIPFQSQNPNVFVEVVIDKNKLLKDIETIQYLEAGQTFIVDGESNPVVSYAMKEKLEWEEVSSRLNGITDQSSISINGKKWLCISQKSLVTNWTYLTLIPYNEITARVREIGWITLYLCIVCVIIIFIFTFFFSKKLYFPIDRLYHKVGVYESNNDRHGMNRRDEFSLIDENIDKMILLNQDLQIKMMKTVPVIQQSVLKDLLHNQISGNEVRLKLETNNIVLPHRYFVVLAFYHKEQKLSAEFVRQIFQESFMNHYVICDEKFIVVLLNYNEGNISDIIAKFTDKPYAVSQGAEYESLSDIVKSYHQAQYAWQYRTLSKEFEYLTITDLLKADFSRYRLPFSFREQYKNCIQSGKQEDAFELVKSLVEGYFRPDVPIFFLEKFYEELYSFAEDMVRGGQIRWDNFINRKAPLERGRREEYSLEDYQKDILQIYQELLRYQRDLQGSKEEEILMEIMEIIEKHYREDLSLEMISDTLGLPYSSMSKLFKKKVGEGFVEYITRIRIEDSIELLKDESLSIDAISRSVGYANTPTFIRNFKKIKGVSPGKYRSLMDK